MKRRRAKPFLVALGGDRLTWWQGVCFTAWFLAAIVCSEARPPHSQLFFATLGVLFLTHAVLWARAGLAIKHTDAAGILGAIALPVAVALGPLCVDWRQAGRLHGINYTMAYRPMRSWDHYVSILIFMLLSTLPWYALGVFISRRRSSQLTTHDS